MQWIWDVCNIIITKCHTFTNNINKWTLAGKINNQTMMALSAFGNNDFKLAVIDFSSEFSPIDIVTKIMKLGDYEAKNSKFIAYSLIFIGCIVVMILLWKCFHISTIVLMLYSITPDTVLLQSEENFFIKPLPMLIYYIYVLCMFLCTPIV